MSTQGYDPSTGYMDFSLALREMKKGKTVKRAGWSQGVRLVREDDFQWQTGQSMFFLPIDVVATDWEEVL